MTTLPGIHSFTDQDEQPASHLKVVLYLGMGDDIMSPLELVPDLDVLFVIDEFDERFSSDSTPDGQINDIIKTLKEGKMHSFPIKRSDRQMSAYSPDHLMPVPILNKSEWHYLSGGKSEILMDARYREHNPAIKWDWRLRFKYAGKVRTLMRFERDFYEVWPQGIANVSHLMFMGSSSIPMIVKDLCDRQRQLFFGNIRECMKRTGYRIYALSFNHAFKHHVVIKNGKDAEGTCIGYEDVDPRWLDIVPFIMHRYDKESVNCTLLVKDTGKQYNVKWNKSVIRL